MNGRTNLLGKTMHFRGIKAIWLFFLLTLACATSRYKPPRVISNNKLEYPLTAQLERIEGDVLVGVFVNKEGQPEEIELIESSGHKELDEAALLFVKKVDFSPARLDEKSISSWTRLVLRYRLSEVIFNKEDWLAKVEHLNHQASEEPDSAKHELILQDLYTDYLALVEYADLNDDPAINQTIKLVLSKSIRNRWYAFWDYIPAPFAVFDDFIERYPKSPLTSRVNEDLIRQLVDAEYKIRIKALKSRRFATKSAELIQMLEIKLDELQNTAREGDDPE
jgi:TonB family protein